MTPHTRPPLGRLFLLAAYFIVSSCSATPQIQTSTPAHPTTVTIPSALLTDTSIPTVALAPTLTLTPAPTPIPTPTKIPSYIGATVWTAEPIVPVLTWHQFVPDYADSSNSVRVRLSDFRQELQDLYDAGYSLISLAAWLRGDLQVPEGRRPLIFTMDDLFFNNQITLLEDNTPSPKTGIGILYQFYQAHPDFGLHGALFVTLGDKLYANPDLPDWEDKLARAVAWVTEHDLIPYNHTYLHPRLSNLAPGDIVWELQTDDKRLRDLLIKAGRPDLITKLGNIIAVPYGIWPTSQAGMEALINYQNPEGLGVEALMDIDSITRHKFMLPSYDPAYDYRRVPRIVATLNAIQYLVDNQQDFPRAQFCRVGPVDEARVGVSSYLASMVVQSISQGSCPVGVYALRGFVFRADALSAMLLPIRISSSASAP